MFVKQDNKKVTVHLGVYLPNWVKRIVHKELFPRIKRLLHLKIEILSLITYPHVIPNP